MGGAIALGAISGGLVAAPDITISHLSEKMHPLFGDLRHSVVINNCNAEAVANAEMVVVAVKPWLLREVLAEISPRLDRSRQSLISVVAGCSFAELSSMLHCDELGQIPLFRVIPNTAISIGQGVSIISNCGGSDEQRAMVTTLFEAMGATYWVEESQLTPFTSLTSCGVAFILRYFDAAMRGGEQVGIEPATALEATLLTAEGAIALLRHNGSLPAGEIDKVTTKGGITLKGLEALESEGFSRAVAKALRESR